MSKAPSVQKPGTFLERMQRAPTRYADHLDRLYHAETRNELAAELSAAANDRFLSACECSDVFYFADVLNRLKFSAKEEQGKR